MNRESLGFANYCVCFIDLLGQREEYKGQGLLPLDKGERDEFVKKIRNTIGSIDDLQESVNVMITEAGNPIESIKNKLPVEFHPVYDEFKRVRPKQQRWSDGLMLYVSLMTRESKCPMNGVFELFSNAGSLCFLGLAKRKPLRGAIDVAWAVELHENELYGAAVAAAYELESKVAMYPRIVVGHRAVRYLEALCENTEHDCYAMYNKDLAMLCLKMLALDADGHFVLHYLGNGFRDAVSKGQHQILYAMALKYVQEQYIQFRDERNSKMAFRYTDLLSYFHAHPPETIDLQHSAEAGVLNKSSDADRNT